MWDRTASRYEFEGVAAPPLVVDGSSRPGERSAKRPRFSLQYLAQHAAISSGSAKLTKIHEGLPVFGKWPDIQGAPSSARRRRPGPARTVAAPSATVSYDSTGSPTRLARRYGARLAAALQLAVVSYFGAISRCVYSATSLRAPLRLA